MQQTITPELLDVRATAALLNCSPRQVWRLSDRGSMPAPINPGGARSKRWRRAELLAWLERGAPDLRRDRGPWAAS